MAYSQADLDVLRAALASGVLRVQYNDRLVVYRSLDEIRAAIQIVEGALSTDSGSTPVRRSYASFSRD